MRVFTSLFRPLQELRAKQSAPGESWQLRDQSIPSIECSFNENGTLLFVNEALISSQVSLVFNSLQFVCVCVMS